MHKFIKFSFTVNAKNTQFCSHIISVPTLNKKCFSTTTAEAPKPEKVNKYSDKYKLSQDEVQAILKKPKKKPNVMAQTEVERADIRNIYEKSIEEQLGSLRFNTVKEFNTKLGVAQKVDLEVPQTRPSDRPDVKYYKYDLPIPNIDPEIQGLDDIFERERAKRVTVNQDVWGVLDLGAEDSYQAYEKGLQQKFNFELDMYGDVTNVEEKRNHEIEVRGENVLPMLRINNEGYMGTLRKCFSLNINMPGTLENEDPNKFIRGLRPIEEFRHTPLVPISERVMNEHKKKLEEYHRGGLYFEVKKETLANYGIFLSFIFLGYNLFTWLMEKEEETSVNYERLKLRRIQQS